MKIPCIDIGAFIKKDLAKKVKELKKKHSVTPKLVTILIGSDPAQLSFVAIKKRVATELGIDFEFVHIETPPPFLTFANRLREIAHRPETTGVIIQQPLPTQLHSDTLYNYIPLEKEIESHRKKSPFLAPMGLTILTVLKYVYLKQSIGANSYVDLKKDTLALKQIFKHKKIVVIGRGVTGGIPITQTLSNCKINYININSTTFNPDQYIKEADLIITAVGKEVVKVNDIKNGVVLINIGLHKNAEGKLVGDYNEEEIKKVASHYTTTPKGTGPIDVLYLYKNLIDAAYMQLKKK